MLSNVSNDLVGGTRRETCAKLLGRGSCRVVVKFVTVSVIQAKLGEVTPHLEDDAVLGI